MSAKVMTTPGTGDYRHFLKSYADAARLYGADPTDIEMALRAVDAKGLSAMVDPSRMFLRVWAPAAKWQQVLGAPLAVAKATPAFPFDFYDFQTVPVLSPKLQYVGVGATVYVPSVDAGARRTGASVQNAALINERDDDIQLSAASLPQAAAFPANTGVAPPGTCLSGTPALKGVYLPAQIANAYKSIKVGENAATRAARVSVIDLGGGYADADAQGAAKCLGYTPPKIQLQTGDGVGSGRIKGNDEETQLDLQTMGAYVPGGTIQLIQTTNGPASLLDALSRSFGDPNGYPDAASISYAQCAIQEAQSNIDVIYTIERVIMLGMTVGSSVFVAAGDACPSDAGANAPAS